MAVAVGAAVAAGGALTGWSSRALKNQTRMAAISTSATKLSTFTGYPLLHIVDEGIVLDRSYCKREDIIQLRNLWFDLLPEKLPIFTGGPMAKQTKMLATDHSQPALRQAFPWAFRPEATAIEKMWDESLITLDTNILLLVYRMSEKSREQLLKAIEGVASRLMIPYQVGYEFMRNRETVLLDQRAKIEEMHSAFSRLEKALTDSSRIPLEMEELRKIAREAKSKSAKLFQLERKALADVGSDDMLVRVAEIIGQQLCKKPTSDEYAQRCQTAAERIARKIPPGFLDAEIKPVPDCYGDYLIWCELLNLASKGRSIIFVTDEKKPDWWLVDKHRQPERAKLVGARSELVREMWEQSGVSFHLATPDDFIEYGQRSLDLDQDVAVVEEVRRASLPPPTRPRPASVIWQEMLNEAVAANSLLSPVSMGAVTRSVALDNYRRDLEAMPSFTPPSASELLGERLRHEWDDRIWALAVPGSLRHSAGFYEEHQSDDESGDEGGDGD